MPQKQLQQAQDREAHRQQQADAKARRRQQPTLVRDRGQREEKPLILIVCEGANTEPSYFRQFRLANARIKAIGTGTNTLSLVLRAALLAKGYGYDQVWCVYDKDSFSANDFNASIKAAIAKGMRLAWSNQAFEYWLILHFEDHQGGALHRQDYGAKINSYLKPLGAFYDYDGSKLITPAIFEILSGRDPKTGRLRIELAIERAHRNMRLHEDCTAAQAESCTLVHTLVEELRRHQ
jgi:RloB-like protein